MDNKNELSHFIMDMREFKNRVENIGKDGTTLFNEFEVFKKVSEQFERYDRAEAVRRAVLEFKPQFDLDSTSASLFSELKNCEISESQWDNIFESLKQSQNHRNSTKTNSSTDGNNYGNDDNGDNLPPNAPIPSPVS